MFKFLGKVAAEMRKVSWPTFNVRICAYIKNDKGIYCCT